MLGDSENVKDTQRDTGKNPVKDSFSNNSVSVPYLKSELLSDSYPKLNKLITALYIVTDIIEKDEPIRLKLRTLGVEILSDMNSTSRTELYKKTVSVLSFLDIASAINLISEMNFNILKKEFTELAQFLEASKESTQVNHLWLEDFLKPKETFIQKDIDLLQNKNQKDKATSEPKKDNKDTKVFAPTIKDWNASYSLKKQRREEIIKAIKMNGGSATIAEVKAKAGVSLAGFSEKTLQRELVSMVKELVLDKTGDKRWSKYVLKA